MSENFNYSDKINAYFNQAMSEGEQRLFEQQVAQDPLLKAEFDLQKDIIEALKDTRRAELKTRLQDLPTPGPGFVSIPAQFIGGAFIVGAALVTGYVIFNHAEDLGTSDDRQIVLTADNIFRAGNESLPTRPETAYYVDETTEFSEAGEVNETGRSLPAEDSRAALNKTTRTEQPLPEESPTTNIDLPTLLDENDGNGDAIDNTRIELPESGLDPLEEDLTENVEIEHLASESDELQYRFYNSKLYLFGSFGEVPYEILEINRKKGKSYYLYHNALYYRLQYDQVDPTPLREITNKRIIHELDIVRKNK